MPRKVRRADLFFIASAPSGASLKHAWRPLEVRRDGQRPWPAPPVWQRLSPSEDRLQAEWLQALEEESLLPIENASSLPQEFNLVLFEPQAPLAPVAIVRDELITGYQEAVEYQRPLLFEEQALFGPFFWKLSPADELLNEEELRLVFLDAVDAERRKFEKLRRQFAGNDPPVSVQRRQRIPEDVRIFVWRRDEGKCVRCSSQRNLEFDHIVPVSKGGSSTARNVQLLCEACNRKKGPDVA